MAKAIIDYKKWLLNTLLDKYEQSSAFQTGVFNRRIMITIPKEKALQEVMEQIDEKHLFLTVLEQLKNQGLIEYSWVKYETGNLVDQVWLITENLAACYKEISRVPAAELLASFNELASAYLEKVSPSSDFAGYISSLVEYAATKKKLKSPFTEDMKLNTNLFECLVALDKNPDQMERVFSSRHYGDSKYFERVLKNKVISILKELQKSSIGSDEDSANDLLSDEDLLVERGLYRWPEIYEFNGPLSIRMDDGTVIDMSTQVYGSYINSDAVKHIASIDGSNIQRVVFIENKANYIDYQANHKGHGDLIVYHGGFYSPMKGLLFSKIYEGCPNAVFYHWSDIDLGGFRLFNRLRTNIVPSVQPLYMDVETLQANLASCMNIKTDGYIQMLTSLLKSPEYSMFYEVIQYMIEKKVRLEQENLI
ncbi:hypothetical protein JQM64_00285 [Fournierella massiliensis]|nr:Wadjet anti-phage system protein JetD domain-containing protein [Fournierella massiliensis]MCF2555988.1 hypothetical protein [Fournierella massiliensis]